MRGSRYAWAFVGALAACSVRSKSIAVEDNDLGIVNIEIEGGTQGSESLLSIRGYDIGGDEVASAAVRTGIVMHTWDPEVAPPAPVDGREVTLRARESRFSTTTPGRQPDSLPGSVLPQSTLASFVRLGAVAHALADAGITFRWPEPGESAYSSPQGCSPDWFPTHPASGEPPGSNQCGAHWVGNDELHAYHVTSRGTVTMRLIRSACTVDGSGGSCQDMGCTYGPCGARIIDMDGPGPSRVFIPFSTTEYVGVDTDVNDPNAGSAGPANEEFNGSQSIYNGVSAACEYTGCYWGNIPYVGRCGNNVCEGPEDSSGCPQDCAPACLPDWTACDQSAQCCSGFCNPEYLACM